MLEKAFWREKSARFLSVCFSTAIRKVQSRGVRGRVRRHSPLPSAVGGFSLFVVLSFFFGVSSFAMRAERSRGRLDRSASFERRFWCAPAIGVVDARVVPRPHRFGRAHSPEIVRGERNARIARGTVARDPREGGGVERGRQKRWCRKIDQILLLSVVVLLLLLINVKARRRLEERKATRRLCSRTLR